MKNTHTGGNENQKTIITFMVGTVYDPVMVFRFNQPMKHDPPNKVRDAILSALYDLYRGPDGKMIEKHGGHEMVLEVASTYIPPKVD